MDSAGFSHPFTRSCSCPGRVVRPWFQAYKKRMRMTPAAILLWATFSGVLGPPWGAWAGETPYYRDLFPDTWVGHDAVGRNMPSYFAVGPVKQDHRRVVGIFYI